MTLRRAVGLVVAGIVVTMQVGFVNVTAQQPGGGGGNAALFPMLDANRDGVLTRDEMKTGLDGWYTKWDGTASNGVTMEQVMRGLAAVVPPPPPTAPAAQNRTPAPEHVTAMIAALPETAPVKPARPRKVLVLGKAQGFVHSSIPIAARTIEEMGKKYGAWSTTITYDPADINEANLTQYDAIFLASTTGQFLDDPNDAKITEARRKALLDFVRGGKGIAGVHAACDSYHRNAAQPANATPTNWAALGIASRVMVGDVNGDGKLTRQEFATLGEGWFDKLDTEKTGRVAQADFPQRFAAIPASAAPARPAQGNGQGPATDLTPDKQTGTWPEFNKTMGAFFKWHWNDGQPITVKVDEPNHPLNAAFGGKSWEIVDETYTFGRDTYSRRNLRVLTSIDYAKMSAQDKAKENNPRSDGDYALSWVRAEGKGRVFYEAHGHNENIYANKLFVQHVLAGMQYVIGDLKADDSPSVK